MQNGAWPRHGIQRYAGNPTLQLVSTEELVGLGWQLSGGATQSWAARWPRDRAPQVVNGGRTDQAA